MASKEGRRGSVSATRKQYDILCQLRDGLESEQPLVKLDIKNARDARTLEIMQTDKDWIVSSTKVFEEVRYAITSRGLKVLKALEAPLRRTVSDMCYRCGERPRHKSSKGRRLAYCVDCQNAYNRERYAKRAHVYRSDKPCSCCKRSPRHVNKNGHRETYCLACRRAKGAMRKHRLYERVMAEGLELCARCGKHPQFVTGTVVYHVCRDCFNARRRANTRKRRSQRLHAIQMRLKGFKPA